MNHRNGKRILLADNSVGYRRSVVGLLKLDGYFVVEASTPEEAMDMIAGGQFDLVLADLRMRDEDDANDVDGLEIAKFASERGIPCIIITGFPTVELARIALRARGREPIAWDMIPKASGPQALLDSIGPVFELADAKLAGDPTTQAPPPKDEPKTKGPLVIDLKRKLIWKDGVLLRLPPKQYTLLEELFKKDGGVCSYTELLWAIYGEQIVGKAAQNEGRLRNLVDRTNDNVKDEDSDHEYIEAVPGRGFRLNLEP